jgi:Fis family transcriptional regulator
MSNQKQIEDSVREGLQRYFEDLGGVEPSALYELFMGVVERPLLEGVLQRADGNQSRAAEWLGINRNTLRRKLLDHKLME